MPSVAKCLDVGADKRSLLFCLESYVRRVGGIVALMVNGPYAVRVQRGEGGELDRQMRVSRHKGRLDNGIHSSPGEKSNRRVGEWQFPELRVSAAPTGRAIRIRMILEVLKPLMKLDKLKELR